jgi:hypothetical protein
MSALGHKRTYAPQQVMSALPPKATAKADFRKKSCLLCPPKADIESGADPCWVKAVLTLVEHGFYQPRMCRAPMGPFLPHDENNQTLPPISKNGCKALCSACVPCVLWGPKGRLWAFAGGAYAQAGSNVHRRHLRPSSGSRGRSLRGILAGREFPLRE